MQEKTSGGGGTIFGRETSMDHGALVCVRELAFLTGDSVLPVLFLCTSLILRNFARLFRTLAWFVVPSLMKVFSPPEAFFAFLFCV